MNLVPEPDPEDAGVHEVASASLEPGEKVTLTLKPETSGSVHRIFAVAASKYKGATYQVDIDGNTSAYGPAPSPPTDPDDLQTTFVPARRLSRKMEVVIRDVRASGGPRQYLVHVLGWEVSSSGA